jgi:flagellar biosynthesis/type III secretory pathway M-ring protein FliF/YscJ
MVTVVPRGAKELDESQVPKIRDLVASAIGISAESVTVVDANGRSYAGGKLDGVAAGAFDDPYFARKKSYEAYYEQKTRQALSYVPGVTVIAHVELDPQMSRREEKNGDPHERTVTEFAALTPKKVTISVGVPDSFYEDLWRKTRPASEAQSPAIDKKALERIEQAEKAKLQQFVAQSIPQGDATRDVRPLVTVTTFARLASAESPSPAAIDRVVAWLSAHAATLGTFALALASLFLLRSLLRNPAPRLALAAPATKASPTTAKSNLKNDDPRAPTGRRRPGATRREELVESVRQNPDAAANILRTWIGGAT